MPKVSSMVPTIRKTSLGSTCAELGHHRIVLHDKDYSVSQSKNGWHREHFVENGFSRGWVICDELPSDVEAALKRALNL